MAIGVPGAKVASVPDQIRAVPTEHSDDRAPKLPEAGLARPAADASDVEGSVLSFLMASREQAGRPGHQTPASDGHLFCISGAPAQTA